MSTPGLNLLAISIFSITLLSLLGPLIQISPTVPALTTFVLLGLITVDSLAWSNQGTTLVVDWFAQRSPQHRDRILYHEAGHLLVAMLLGVPVTGYALSAWEALRQGQQAQGGVRFEDGNLQAQLEEGYVTGSTIDRYCQVWLAGGVAEQRVYGTVEGAGDDRRKVRLLLSAAGTTPHDRAQKERWAVLQVKGLLERNWDRYEALVELLRRRAPLAECQQLFQDREQGVE
ncbi:MAG: ATP-dependent Zn protease [Prochlorothrix sp.]|nr:ATP-dependent Zn protease [Prochlorothrix sp.]